MMLEGPTLVLLSLDPPPCPDLDPNEPQNLQLPVSLQPSTR